MQITIIAVTDYFPLKDEPHFLKLDFHVQGPI